MRYESPLPARIRGERQRRSLSQAALAGLSATSRVTVARFEAGAGQDVRLGTLARLCAALGLELVARVPGEAERLEVQLARERERLGRMDRRRRHALVAVRLLSASPGAAAAMIGRARDGVDRWERERLCSPHYVSRWRRMLAGPVRRVARSLLRDDEWTDALFQNSPWGFALGPSV
jgi:transcriptional regulator with XRE-family HTH domain